jgi:nucleoside-diphosphate-sugar epimerase
MAKFLITGGSGMVAQHTAEAALKAGHAVRLADVAWPDGRVWISDVERVTFDLRDTHAAAEHADGTDAVIHCGAVVGLHRARIDAMITLDVNVGGTAGLLAATHAAGTRLVSMSTATLYGDRPDLQPLDEDDKIEPLGLYDGSKAMAEIYCTTHKMTLGGEVASIRTGFVYGFGNQIGEYFLPKAMDGIAIAERTGREHPCDFTYVVDLAEALIAMATAPALPQTVYNVTGGVLRTRGELATIVRKLIPSAEISQGEGLNPERHLRGPCRLDRVRHDVGWSPRFTLETGMADWLARIEASR